MDRVENWGEVDRPTAQDRRRRQPSAEMLAVLDTVHTGKAIRVPLNGRLLASVRANLSFAARRRGLQAHCCYNKDDDTVTTWMEER